MLYVNTRDRADSFTAYRALHEQYAPNGGLFVPFRLPVFTDQEISSFQHKSFGEAAALILNLFFGSNLVGRDIDLMIGAHPVRLTMMPHRLVMCELWHNTDSSYEFIEAKLFQRIGKPADLHTTDWAKIVIRIAILFGLYTELRKNGIREGDIAVPAGDFSIPMAAWYARKMGLPLGVIICGCNENSSTWDLIHRGECNTGSAVINTNLPLLDVAYPLSAERLIFETLGLDEAKRYADVCAKGGLYTLDEASLSVMNDGVAAAVVSSRRTKAVITSLYRSNGYIADGYTAVAYGALQDYRASTGESRTTLLLSDNSPGRNAAAISSILGVSQEEIQRKL